MRIDVTKEKGLFVAEWDTAESSVAIAKIEQQLNAAIAVWPSLKGYELVRVKSK